MPGVSARRAKMGVPVAAMRTVERSRTDDCLGNHVRDEVVSSKHRMPPFNQERQQAAPSMHANTIVHERRPPSHTAQVRQLLHARSTSCPSYCPALLWLTPTACGRVSTTVEK
eukprot:6196421-Pleurochrysis_carterae.AAC.3